jgi:hypothetical protein
VAHLKRELADAEAEVDKLETKREDLIRAIAHPTLYRDQGKSAQLIAQQRALGQVEKDLSAAEDRWAKAQEQWDAAHV